MRNSLRILILLLCLIQLGSVVFAAEPGFLTAASDPAVTQAETEPAETEPAETEPAETEPVETEPAETEPVETEPVETEPVETEPAETEPAEPPVSEMTDAEIIEKYSIKDNWARNGLIFAVRNGILAGKGGNKLCPTDNTSHAELATMLMSLLKTEKQASMDRFTDVQPQDWYYTHMAKAVSLGIFPIANPKAKTLTPKALITREEAYVAIARVFGVHGNGRQSIYRFSDWKEVSAWAAEDISAMIDAGLLGGNGGKIMPKSRITRQELAVILAGLLTKVDTSLKEDPFTGRIALAAESIPDGATINGDLLLSTDSSSITLRNVTVTGRLIMQGNGTLNLRLSNCTIGELVLCRPTVLSSNQVIANVTAHNELNLSCHVSSVQVYSRCTVRAGYSAETVNAMNNTVVTVAGTVKHMMVVGDNVTINGSGTIKTLHRFGLNLTNSCRTDSTVGTLRTGPQDVTASRTDSSVPSSTVPKVTLKLKLLHMPEGWSECDLSWCLNGKEFARTERNLCKEGTVVSQTYDFRSYLDGSISKATLTVYSTIDGSKKKIYSGELKLDAQLAILAKQIRTQNVQGKLTQASTLCTNMNLTGAIANYPAGTQVTILQSRQSRYTKVRTPDGNVGWVSFYAVQPSSEKFYTTEDYSAPLKEYYVNQVRNASSSTNYLIWVSLYTQRVNIFQGSKGNWKLIQSGQISSGRNACPTPAETTKILYKTSQWEYEVYYCHHVSVFDEARGFHSRPTAYGGGVYQPAIGYPVSSGCVRLMDSECIFIYN
ncbi:MAG: S-layer homology domain-containing protein, partial [Oscillospiraceae bacterium]|nr:S-layer homology domain-containing protein [Oscillospiraceae bacterium]